MNYLLLIAILCVVAIILLIIIIVSYKNKESFVTSNTMNSIDYATSYIQSILGKII